MAPRLYIGTCGFSVWYSDDLGETLQRLLSDSGLYSESRIFALSAHPDRPGQLLAGTDSGVYRLDPSACRWTHLTSPMDQMSVWSIAHSPRDPDVILAGTRPAAIFRSVDGGRRWQRVEAPFPETCRAVLLPRVTRIAFDVEDDRLVWAGLEIGGLWRSTDGGAHWRPSSTGLVSDDIHDVAVAGGPTRIIFATTNQGLHVSRDDGELWKLVALDSPWQYTRGVVAVPDRHGVVFIGNGDGPPGSAGRLFRSRDRGAHWEEAGLPGEVRSTLYSIATHPSDPKLIFAATALGQFFRSTDGGDSWTCLPRQLGETRALAWLPN